jgi:alanine dehydrogenase
VLVLEAEHIRNALDRLSTINALDIMFRDGCEAPVRHHHTVTVPEAPKATMLLMPAWSTGKYLGIKIANVFPGNGSINLPAVQAVYLLFSGKTGELLASMDGGELTARRTAAASALAARYLAREDASRLLIVGTGRLSQHIAASYAAIRPITEVMVWGRNSEKAEAVVRNLEADGIRARFVVDLASAIPQADIVSCATLSRDPIVRGEWLSPGTHLDLIGGFTPEMREADDEVVRRSSIFVDTREGAVVEAGDIVVPLRNGILKESDIRADLPELARGKHLGRTSDSEITLFKSVGASQEDLAAAALAFERFEKAA